MSHYHTINLTPLSKAIIDLAPDLVRSVWLNWDGRRHFGSRGRVVDPNTNTTIHWSYWILRRNEVADLVKAPADKLPPGDWIGLHLASHDGNEVAEHHKVLVKATKGVLVVHPKLLGGILGPGQLSSDSPGLGKTI